MSYYISILTVIAAYLSWSGLIAYAIVEWAYVIQLKEYRLDRLKDFFLSKKGRQFLSRYSTVGLILLAITIIARFDIVLVLILGAGLLYCMHKDGLLRPVWTMKAILFVVIAGVSYFSISISARAHDIVSTIPYGFVLLHVLLPVAFILLALALQFPTTLAKRYYIAKATKKLATYPNLKVIGITGSYGKTSARNFLVQILATNYQVITTPKNINTEIGIATFILAHDFSRDDIFVVEMGAYRKGEIKLIADMVRPSIGIITTIGPEHLALFGSMERIRDTKGELFAALPQGGLAITNADNQYCRQLLETYKHLNIQTFGTVQLHHPNLLISDVVQETESIGAIFNYKGDDIVIRAPLFGTHHAMNIAAALLAAEHMRMDRERIVSAIQTLTPPPHRLNRIKQPNNVIILDDTYNSNPEGFLEAVDLLALQDQKKKIVITRGMIELGAQEAEAHVRVGQRIGEMADMLIIISPDNAEHLRAGALAAHTDIQIETVYDMGALVGRFREIVGEGDVAVLLENRVPEGLLL